MTQHSNSSLILCSTPRLARGLQGIFQREQLKKGAVKWEPLNAVPLSHWLGQVLDEAILLGEIDAANMPGTELNPLQESLLWEQSVRYCLKSHEAKDLFDASGLASAAMEANRLIIEWNLHINMDEATEETKRFLEWRKRFQWLCKQNGYLESVRYGNWRLDLLESGVGTLPAHIQFAGFDRINPQLKRLQDVLVKRGVKVNSALLTFDSPQEVKHIVLTNQDAECRAAVAWAKAQLAENPQVSIAIVVPELAALRSKFSALLDDVLQASASRPALAESQRCYDFSLGVPLNTQPVIATAIHLLQLAWQRGSIFQQEIFQLLQSPYWSEGLLEADARALLDARMRRDLPLSFNATRLQNYMQKVTAGDGGIHLPATIKALQDLLGYAQKQESKQLPSAWALVLGQALVHADWPGRRSLSSFEYQATKSFDKVISALAGLDDLLDKIDAKSVISQLIKLCQAQIFQPESKQIPRLQIMGMMEAAAAPLHAMWVMGMNDHIWPPIARPNALISASLQRAAETPNASSEVQVAFAKAIHERLIKSARSVIFSSAIQDGDRQLRASPLMQDIPLASGEVALAKTLAEQLADVVPVEVSNKPWQWLDDNQAPAVEDGGHVSGGTGLLKAQAICPAWAFYQYRLYARALKEPVDGLDAMDRGNLVHQVLEVFWDGRDSAYLQALSETEMQAVLEQAADKVLTLFNQEHDEAFSAAFIQLEKERLVKLVMAWLNDVEKAREMGFSVQAVERKQTIPIDSLSITLTVDRVDQLEDGRLVVLDYKTGGTIDFKNWANANISEPQLPIYAAFLMGDAEVAAVCFAKVLLEKAGYAGIAASKGVLQGATPLDENRGRKIFAEADFPNWPSVIAHWKNSITATAQAIKAGDAAVKFENEKQLAYCEVLPLLRLAERQLQFEYQQAELHQQVLGGL
jgi:probable DNA repair protein